MRNQMLTNAKTLQGIQCNVWAYIFHRAEINCISTRQNVFVSMKNTICATISFLHVIFYAYRAVKQSFCLAIENQYKDAALLQNQIIPNAQLSTGYLEHACIFRYIHTHAQENSRTPTVNISKRWNIICILFPFFLFLIKMLSFVFTTNKLWHIK